MYLRAFRQTIDVLLQFVINPELIEKTRYTALVSCLASFAPMEYL